MSHFIREERNLSGNCASKIDCLFGKNLYFLLISYSKSNSTVPDWAYKMLRSRHSILMTSKEPNSCKINRPSGIQERSEATGQTTATKAGATEKADIMTAYLNKTHQRKPPQEPVLG